MVDWKGLLNWSMKYTDGTKPSQFKPLSLEDQKFIEGALESICINEMKEIWKILDTIKTREGSSETEINERLDLLETLAHYIDGPENARNIVRGKRFIELITYFFECKHKEVKIALGRLITQMMQNDGYIQKAAMDFGIFAFLKELHETSDKELIGMYIYMLTGIIYGDELEVRKHFVLELDGVVLLFNMLLKQKDNFKNTKRLLNIFLDLNKITDKHAKEGISELREKTLMIMKDINLHKNFVLMLNDYDYSCTNNLDVIHIIMDNIVNVCELFEDVNIVFDQIKKMNDIINKSPVLGDADKKEEKMYLIQVIKSVKMRLSEVKYQKENKMNEKEEHEVKMLGNKESMRIELKK